MFYNYNPVKLIHGKGALQRAAAEIPVDSRLAVLHGTTHQRNLDAIKIISSWHFSDINYIKVPQHEPTLTSIDELLCQIPTETTFIIGIGGGSVMDSTKAVAACFGNHLSPWELKSTSPLNWQNTTPFSLVSTRPGSGSELNNAFVLMDDETKFKRSYFSIYTYANFAVHDPIYYQSLGSRDFSWGLADSISHIIDQFLVERPEDLIQDSLSLAFLKIGFELGQRCHTPSSKDFLQLSWFSGLVSSGLLSRGVKTSWILHEIAHSLGSIFDLPHPVCITMALPLFLELPRHPENRLQQIAEVLAPQSTSRRCTERILKFFCELGMPIGFDQLPKEGLSQWQIKLNELCPNLSDDERNHLCNLQL